MSSQGRKVRAITLSRMQHFHRYAYHAVSYCGVALVGAGKKLSSLNSRGALTKKVEVIEALHLADSNPITLLLESTMTNWNIPC